MTDSKTLRRNALAAVKIAKAEQAAALAVDDDAVIDGDAFLRALGVGVVAAEEKAAEVEVEIAARGKASRKAYASWAGRNGFARDM